MRLSRKLRIAVLLGGLSSEREISIKSGRCIARALKASGFEVREVMVNDTRLAGVTKENFDVAFIALHGKWGEDGGVQRLLRRRGIPFSGSDVRSSMLAMDKIKSKRTFQGSGILIPRYEVIRRGFTGEKILKAADRLGYPVILKPVSEGSSIGVEIICGRKNVDKVTRKKLLKYGRCIMEEYIEGREMTVGILRGRALPVIEIRPKVQFFDYKAKYNGSTREIPNPSLSRKARKELKEMALAAHESLGCRGFSRVDMILSEDERPYILEVNTIPGFTEESLLPKAAHAAGISFENLCRRIVLSVFNGK